MKNDVEFAVRDEWQNNIAYKPWFFDFYEDFLYFLIFYPMAALVLVAFEKTSLPYYRALMILPVFIVMTICRRVSKNITVFFLLIALSFTATLFVPLPIDAKLLLVGTAIFTAITSTTKLMNEIKSREVDYDRRNAVTYSRFITLYTLLGGLVLTFFVYMIAFAYGKQTVMVICLFSFSIFLIAYQIYVHQRGNYVLKDWEQVGKDASAKNFTVLFTALLASGLGVVSFVIYQIVYLTGLNNLDNSILYFLTHRKPVIIKPLTEAVKKVRPEKGPNIREMAGKAHVPTFLEKLMIQFLNTVVWIMVAVFVIIMLAALFRWILGILRRRRKNINEETQSVFSLREAKNNVAEKLKSLTALGGLIQGSSNSIKIRRLYYKAIQKISQAGTEIVESDTPCEISEKVKNRVSGDISAVTALYEKARYAKDECTPEEVKAAKLYMERKKNS